MPPRAGRKREAWAWGLSVALLMVEFVWAWLFRDVPRSSIRHYTFAAGISLIFAACVFVLRGATLTGAFAGFTVAFGFAIGRTADLASLIALFVLTWAATVVHSSKRDAGKPQPRDGIQVLANIGLAPVLYMWGPGPWFAAIAVLAEAAADTVASEIGQAFGGTPRLITTMRRVPIGANGGVTVLGTAAGVAAAIMVALAVEYRLCFFQFFFWQGLSFTTISAVAGLFLDSFLGAVLEPRILSNDAVNFLSVTFTGIVATVLMWVFLLPPI
jgi:uncharacterized protein (TIGR00297 family)